METGIDVLVDGSLKVGGVLGERGVGAVNGVGGVGRRFPVQIQSLVHIPLVLGDVCANGLITSVVCFRRQADLVFDGVGELKEATGLEADGVGNGRVHGVCDVEESYIFARVV